VFERLLLGFHGFDFATYPGDFFFDLQDVFDLSSSTLEDVAEALFGFTGVLKASDEVRMLLGQFFAGLVFIEHATERFETGERRREFVSRNAKRGLELALLIFGGVD
jgi:hypothetical protein